MSSPDAQILLQLANANQMVDILKCTQAIEKNSSFQSEIKWGCSANITIDPIEITLKKHSFLNHKNPRTVMGSFDSHHDNLEKFKREGVEYVLFINFFDSLVPSLESRASSITPEMVSGLKSKVQAQVQILNQSASNFKMIFISLFHRMTEPTSLALEDPVTNLIDELNSVLRANVKNQGGLCLIDFETIVSEIGRKESFNTRFYYKFKSPYTIRFFDELTRKLFIMLRGGGSHFFKALVLDCDNTLWGGIIGEDQMSGVQLGPYEYPGNIYWSIQHEILSLKNKGVLLVLCSKNNEADVNEVLLNHENRVIQDRDIVLKKINWEDKSENLRQIAKELNIGLDSLVFLDDSEFECNAVRSQLPEVKTIQVPKNSFDYPEVFQQIKELFTFFNSEKTENDKTDKTEHYRIRALALQEVAKFSNQDEYLASLGITVKLSRNLKSAASRISELTQKSNQFNVTTKRYTPQEITQFMESPNSSVYSLEVSDKFGNSGLTGVAIVKYLCHEMFVDSFLMSCRVIGRGIEFSIWEKLFLDARTKDCHFVVAEFIKSPKNNLVESFFEKLGLTLIEEKGGNKKYRSPLELLPSMRHSHLEVSYES